MDSPDILRKPEGYIVPPKQKDHKQTFIFLHGRGDRSDSFGAGLLSTDLPDGSVLRNIFPNAKFVFLRAPKGQSNNIPSLQYLQWFDLIDLDPGSEEADIQIQGLRETVELVHKALKQEIELVGAENVVLGGLSQGCASSLISLLLWDGQPFAACIGMCGWLPFRKLLEDAMQPSETEQNEVLAELQPQKKAITSLAMKLGYSDSYHGPLVFQKVPIFLGHGTRDIIVVPGFSREAARCITALQGNVTHKEYQSLRHWYSPEMLRDIVQFVKSETKQTESWVYQQLARIFKKT